MTSEATSALGGMNRDILRIDVWLRIMKHRPELCCDSWKRKRRK